MVKNTKGGNKSKKGARKHITSSQPQRTRYAVEDGELYGAVVKLYGGSNCEVMCNDGISRLCVIRNKFKGRGKRGNIISSCVWVLVGVRDWEVRIGKPQRCDLLEVYSDSDKEKLRQTAGCSFDILLKVNDDGTTEKPPDDNIIFVSEETYKYENALKDDTEQANNTVLGDADNDVDFDDI
jgi:initiation factor 1A